MTVVDISELARQADDFKLRLRTIKAGIGDQEFGWYPHDSLDNVHTLNKLLKGRFRTLTSELSGALVLDIGSADGDMAFFLESLGFRAMVIDNPETNFNGMRGIRALKAALDSKIEIVSGDVDARCSLPEGRYDLVFFLGILYHLKNPYYMLDFLAQHCRFCFLSTRVARFTPDRVDLRKAPVAYLLGSDELNHDCTNFWIFSEAGLKRLLSRTGWEICDYMTVGDTKKSAPHTLENDERAFCLLHSRCFGDASVTPRLVKGWHGLESSWRWTERVFSVELPAPPQRDGAILEMNFVYPDLLKQRTDKLRIKSTVEGAALREVQFTATGEHFYRARVPENLVRNGTVVAEFELNDAIPPDSIDLRQRGIIVKDAGFRWAS